MKDSVYLIKDILQLVLSQGGTFDVFNSAEFLGHPVTVFLADGCHLLAGELFSDPRVIAQIGLCADNQAGHTRAVVVHLGEPLLPDVFKGGGRGHRETDQKDVGLWIR